MKKVINSYKDKYEQMPVAVKAGIWFTISSFLQKTISFLTMPIFTRLLSTDEFGVVTVYGSWENIFLIFISLNVFYGAFNTAMMDFDKDRDRYASSLIGLVFSIGFLFFIFYLVFQDSVNYLTGMSFFMTVIMFIQILFQSAFSIWMARQKFRYNYIPVTIATLALFGLSPILSIWGIIQFPSFKVEAKLLGNVIAYVVVGFYTIYSLYLKGRSFCVAKYWRYAFIFSAPLIAHYLSSVILGQADRIMISRFVGDGAAGIYSVAYSVSMILTILTTSSNQALVPKLYENIKEDNLDKLKKTIYLLLVATALALDFIMLFGPEIIRIVATDEYIDAIWVIPPIMSSLLFTFIYQLFANIEFYFKKNEYIIFASIVAAIANVALNYYFIPIYGFIAAAYTSLFCYIVYGVFHYYCAYCLIKKNKLYWPFNVSSVLFIACVLMGLMVVSLLLYQYSTIRYAVICVSMLLLFKYKSKIIKLYYKVKTQ